MSSARVKALQREPTAFSVIAGEIAVGSSNCIGIVEVQFGAGYSSWSSSSFWAMAAYLLAMVWDRLKHQGQVQRVRTDGQGLVQHAVGANVFEVDAPPQPVPC